MIGLADRVIDRRCAHFCHGSRAHGDDHLDAFLRARGIDTLIITGCLTDVCCESTARDAMMLNYRAIIVTDANAADTDADADHNAALTAFYTTFGDVMPTEMLVDLLGRG